MMLYSFGHPMQLCCTLFYSRVGSGSNFTVQKLKNYFYVLAVFALVVFFNVFNLCPFTRLTIFY